MLPDVDGRPWLCSHIADFRNWVPCQHPTGRLQHLPQATERKTKGRFGLSGQAGARRAPIERDGFYLRLVKAMLIAGIGESELARQIGRNKRTVRGWTHGEHLPGIAVISELGRVLNCDPVQLALGRNGHTPDD